MDSLRRKGRKAPIQPKVRAGSKWNPKAHLLSLVKTLDVADVRDRLALDLAILSLHQGVSMEHEDVRDELAERLHQLDINDDMLIDDIEMDMDDSVDDLSSMFQGMELNSDMEIDPTVRKRLNFGNSMGSSRRRSPHSPGAKPLKRL